MACSSRSKKSSGVAAEVVLVAEAEAGVLPDLDRLPHLPVRDPRGERDGVAAGLGLGLLAAGVAEAHRQGSVGRELPLDHGVHAQLALNHVEAAAPQQLGDHLLGDLLVESRLARFVEELRDADRLDRRVHDDAPAFERIAAAAREQARDQQHGPGRGASQPRTATLTRRLGTTTTLTISLPDRCSFTRGSSSALRRTSSSEASRGDGRSALAPCR